MKILIGIFGLFVLISFSFINTEKNQNQINNAESFSFEKADSSKKMQKEDIGIGPIKELKLGAIDEKLVKEGKNIFDSKCMACHRLDSKLVGPPLKNIIKESSPIYVMNYLLNTTEMQKKDPKLKKLIKEYNGVVMPDQSLNKKQARAIIEYLRSQVK
jgi:mono/diheme cytochrome c family protein